ncbi:MATE family efflux transporter [Gloeobacter kilaueensis]|uniref:DNA-damage-inducible protein F n=1 Tax=Gloeobacter kilaueensis (strain ATCC BAA-2537 / CCAP 1431/1 / ULC 316 / JS1) TaxID=1183438 RepID=U5QQJ8_GLOK1|nr:MATE family efflux transporter [Gloeobacter kilaueensis]AGY59960.1 DNA-damage-inducible protein F [Gloeobacter kilaueensis JS1]
MLPSWLSSAIAPRFWRLALVNILSNVMVPVAGLVDVAFLGHLTEVRHLAGVALATVLFDFLYWSFGFLRMSTTGLTAQASGRADAERVVLIGVRHWLVALGLGVALVLLQWPLREVGFALMSATPAVKEAGRQFFDVLIWAAPATLINFVLVGWFLGREQSGRVLALTAVNGLANIVFDYLFIVQWHWQSAGAGAATATSQYLALAVGMVFALGQVGPKELRRAAPFLFDAKELKAIFQLNRDLFIRTFALVSAFALFTNLGAALGTDIVAANAVLLQVVTVGAYFVDGFALATESLAGYFKGEGNPGKLRELLWLSGTASFTSGLGFALVFVVLPGPLFALLSNQPAVLDQLGSFVPWLLPVMAIGSIAWMLDGYFLGLTESRVLRTTTLVAVVCFLPFAWFAWHYHSPHLLWLALAAFMAGRAIPLALCVSATLTRSQPT